MKQTQEKSDDGRLPGAIAAQEPINDARLDQEIDVSRRPERSEPLAEPAALDRWFVISDNHA
jgi:hypothetical protein